MIIWLASYPKSGNTMLRSLLSAYFFTEDGKFKFEHLKNIIQFPNVHLFKSYGIDIKNDREVVKNYINIQKNINQDNNNQIKFIKTHSAPYTIEGHKFTDLENTLGAIYISRDPRNLVGSFSNHYSLSLEKSLDSLTSFSTLGGNLDSSLKADQIVTHLGSWASHYNTWKEFKKINKFFLIKYEDLISNTDKIFLNVLEYIHKLTNLKFEINEKKFKNSIDTTDFENLRRIESEQGFPESIKINQNEKIKFFHEGPKRNWKKDLPKNIKEKIEKEFLNEMLELGYLVNN